MDAIEKKQCINHVDMNVSPRGASTTLSIFRTSPTIVESIYVKRRDRNVSRVSSLERKRHLSSHHPSKLSEGECYLRLEYHR